MLSVSIVAYVFACVRCFVLLCSVCMFEMFVLYVFLFVVVSNLHMCAFRSALRLYVPVVVVVSRVVVVVVVLIFRFYY